MFRVIVTAISHSLLFVILINRVSCDEILNKNSLIDNKNSDNAMELKDLYARARSLARLIYQITNDYFEGCDILIYHDEKFDSHRSIVFSDFYKNFPSVSYFIRGNENFTNLRNFRYQRRDKCCNHMIFLDNIFTIDKIITRDTRNKILIISESTPWTVEDFLRSHASRFYVNLLVITHSMSRRTKEGSYLLYTHKLYTDGSGTSAPFLLTSWINDSLTKSEINLFPEKLNDGFKGHRILISVALKPPFTIRKNVPKSDDTTWDGIDVRIVRLLGEVLNFTAEFRDSTSPTLSPNTAAMNDVKLGIAAAAIGGIYKSTEIVTEFDSPIAYMQDCASFISLASTALPKYRAVMGPFQLSVWLLLCAVYMIAIIPLSINSRYSLRSLLTKPSNLNSMFWYVFSTFTNSFYVKNPMLNSGLGQNFTSILIGMYWVFTIIITSCYTGSIMAFITVPVYPIAMETADQLLRNRYQIATLDHDGWERWFNYTTINDPLAIKLLKNLEYVPTVKEGVRNASRAYFWPYAFLGSKILLEYIVQAEFSPNWSTKRSLMHISNECFVHYGVTIVLPIESIYTETFNKVIIRARQSGLSQKIIRDIEWDVQRSSSGKFLSESGSSLQYRVIPQLSESHGQAMFRFGILEKLLRLGPASQLDKFSPLTHIDRRLEFINSNRSAHTDLPPPNFDEYRKDNVKNANVPANCSSEERKAFMYATPLVSGIVGLYGYKSCIVQCVMYMAPSRDVLAVAQTELKLTTVPEGKVVVAKWRGKPVFVYHRSQETIDRERTTDVTELRDPEADEARVQRPEWLVVIGICTHLGCVPIPNAGMIQGGFYCPCHGSHYDGAGRIRKGPAPRNLDIPEYHFVDDETLLIG